MEKVTIDMGGQKYKLPYELLLSKHQFSFVKSAGFPTAPEHYKTETGNTLQY